MGEKKIGLTTFFNRLDLKLDKIYDKGKSIIKVKICGKIIEIWTNSEKIEQKCMTQFKGFLIDSQEKSDVIFKSWVDNCADYFGEELVNSRGWRREKSCCISIIAGVAFFCGNFSNNTYYFCCQNGKEDSDVFATHVLQIMFAQWALANDLFLLHSASVGIDGKGILIGGKGGMGKSTLAVSCLVNGLDFISDDYVLITKNGEIKAMPVYTTAGLNDDSYKKLLYGKTIIHENKINGKKLIDISDFKISKQLDIKAIILPTKAECNEPEIFPVSAGTILTKMIITTLNQLAFYHDQQMIKELAARLNKLPTYEFKLTSEYDKNVSYLKDFIKENL